jgi:VIT1/CCC1 family predicted Fe2+/Mn2+ transporter
LAADGRPEEETYPWKHGLATLVAFVGAGSVPLIPYMLPAPQGGRLLWSALLTGAALFSVGVARAAVTRDRWWRTGLEMLMLGGFVAAAAYGAGALVAALVN